MTASKRSLRPYETINNNSLGINHDLKDYVTERIPNSKNFLLIPKNSLLPTAWELHKELNTQVIPQHLNSVSHSCVLLTINPTFSVNSHTRIFSCSSIVLDSERPSNDQKNGVPFFHLNLKHTPSNSTSIVNRWKQFFYHLFQRKNNQRYTLLSAYLRQ